MKYLFFFTVYKIQVCLITGTMSCYLIKEDQKTEILLRSPKLSSGYRGPEFFFLQSPYMLSDYRGSEDMSELQSPGVSDYRGSEDRNFTTVPEVIVWLQRTRNFVTVPKHVA